MRISTENVEALLRKYRIHPPVTDERYLQHADVTRGARLRILCATDHANRKGIVISSNRVRWIRACPLSIREAKSLAHELAQEGAIGNQAQEIETVVHLLLRCSQMFATENLQRVRLAPVYVRRNDYRIGGVSMTGDSRVSPGRRLEPRAHDKDAVFAHRPTDRRSSEVTTS